MKRPAVAAVSAVLLVVGLAGGGFAAITTTAAEPGTCDPVVLEDQPDSVVATSRCVVPKATNTVTATETVTATVTATATVTETVTATPTPTPTEPPPPTVPTGTLIGMSAPNSLWTTRLGEVGACGVEARRIFADLTSTGRDQSATIEAAIADGMMPVISYKVPSVTTLNSGGYDSWLDTLHDYLAGLDTQVTVTFWHEPYPDMSGAQFQAGSARFLDHVQDDLIAVGPIMNGFLLDRRVDDFAAYTSPALLDRWDFFGVDSYQGGTPTDPGAMPARAVPLLATWLDEQGHPDMRIIVGEYNGYSGEALAWAGETMLSTPEVWAGLVWNSEGDGGKGIPLDGERLDAYVDTKADPRALHDPAC